jgi:hypothetical protein
MFLLVRIWQWVLSNVWHHDQIEGATLSKFEKAALVHVPEAMTHYEDCQERFGILCLPQSSELSKCRNATT